jgi:hypothetical protein
VYNILFDAEATDPSSMALAVNYHYQYSCQQNDMTTVGGYKEFIGLPSVASVTNAY